MEFIYRVAFFVAVVCGVFYIAQAANKGIVESEVKEVIAIEFPRTYTLDEVIRYVEQAEQAEMINHLAYEYGGVVQAKVDTRYWNGLDAQSRYQMVDYIRIYSRHKAKTEDFAYTRYFQVIGSEGERLADVLMDKIDIYDVPLPYHPPRNSTTGLDY